MAHRFFTLDPITNHSVSLTDEQAHHFLNVMRGKIGDELVVFDGSGVQAAGRVTGKSKKSVQVQILNRAEVDRELKLKLILAVGLPKGDRQKVLVEKLVELGVTRLIPMTTSRSVAAPKPNAINRLRKTVIEASKQCERNVLMQIEDPISFQHVVDSENSSESQLLIATTHVDGSPITQVASTDKVLALVGPEGGFSSDENELAAIKGFQPISLGKRILRVETAAMAIAATLGLSEM